MMKPYFVRENGAFIPFFLKLFNFLKKYWHLNVSIWREIFYSSLSLHRPPTTLFSASQFYNVLKK